MQKLMILLLFCHGASAAKHSLNFHFMISSGNPNIPDYVAAVSLDNIGLFYYDTNMKKPESRHQLVTKLITAVPQNWKGLSQSFMRHKQILSMETKSFKQHSNQTGGVGIVQQILGCEWDDETQKVDGFDHYGYNGEDFLTFDLQTVTWIAANPQAELIKQEWDGNTVNNAFWKILLTNVYPEWLKKYWTYASGFLQRTELPSVSLLQKSPSSPVSCHATGFYPDRALMLWRKDGEDLHEDVDQGEILPNHDGSFQMRVDLDLSSVKPEDWGRYDCVFLLSGVKEEIITKLDERAVKNNKPGVRGDGEFPSAAVIGAVVGLLLLAVCIICILIWRRHNEKQKGFKRASTSDTSSSSVGVPVQTDE